jgi:hypothetical protein
VAVAGNVALSPIEEPTSETTTSQRAADGKHVDVASVDGGLSPDELVAPGDCYRRQGPAAPAHDEYLTRINPNLDELTWEITRSPLVEASVDHPCRRLVAKVQHGVDVTRLSQDHLSRSWPNGPEELQVRRKNAAKAPNLGNRANLQAKPTSRDPSHERSASRGPEQTRRPQIS